MAIEFENNVVAGVVLIRDSIQSQNFEIDSQGEVTGWQINSDGSSTFTSTTIGGSNWGIDDQGVGSFATVNVDDDIIIAGESLVDELSFVPQGLQAYGNSAFNNVTASQWTVNSAAVSANTFMVEFDFGPLLASRYYLIGFSYIAIQTVASDVFRTVVRYTVDGTAPSELSGIMDGGSGSFGGTTRQRVFQQVIYSPAVDYDVVRTGISLNRTSGTGTVQMEFTDANTMMQAWCIDVGDQGVALSGGALSQKSKSSGTPDPPPVSTYVKTYQATWSRSWNSSGSDVNVTNGEISQGQSPATTQYGNRISWVGFDFSTIQSNLSGATVKKVEVYLKFTHWYNNSGGTAIIGTHKSTSTSAPSYNGTLDNQNRKSVSGWAANSAKWVDITSAVGTDFKTGNATGIVIGTGPSTSQVYYGKAAGNSQSGEPALRITYTK